MQAVTPFHNQASDHSIGTWDALPTFLGGGLVGDEVWAKRQQRFVLQLKEGNAGEDRKVKAWMRDA